METSRYVLKKKLQNGNELMGWLDFLHKTRCHIYTIITFKHLATKDHHGQKSRIRFYLKTFDFRLEHKVNIRLTSGFIPYQWNLLQQIKTSTTTIPSFSSVLKNGHMKDNIKTRLEWVMHPELRLTLDLPGNTMEIKTLSLARLYHFILEHNHLFLLEGESIEGRNPIDQE
uniref:Uncharacterized protein n=1 Tax=viral metagenome TaxID=1070528 RepID=A0A6C0K4P2_9ZZZZ